MTKTFPITITNNKPTCAELAGYELPSLSRCQENDVHIDYPDRPLGIQGIVDYQLGFQSGYAKARERFEFTESDLRQAVALSLDDAEKSVIWSKEWYPNKLADKIIASLRAPRTPIAIEVEFTDPAPGDWQPILNPDGTVKGTYIFNE